ncbi:MAG: hypothetical protein E7171_04870 [Firmicutes bacterium]|nr:hypothetical protein [Bacillota bacterium]
MTYEEWLSTIEQLNTTNTNQDLLNKLKQEPVNNNLSSMIVPKLVTLINNRFDLSVNKITKELEYIFTDINYLDLSLLNFKKEIKYLLELINIQHIPEDIKQTSINKLKQDTNKVYDILIKEADKYDYTGVASMTIKNNMIKWSE